MADTFINPIDVPELSATPSNPPSGFRRIYSKTDGKAYQLTSAGVETELTNVAGGSGLTGTSAILTATQANSTVTPAVLTGHTFTIPPGKTLLLTGQLIFTAAATTTGAGYGIRVAQPAGANGNAQGSWSIQVQLSSAVTATGLRDGDVFNVAANTNALGEVLGTASVAGNNSATTQAVIKNQSSNVTTTVTVEFRSEVATSAVTAQIGTSAAGVLI
jgi:hypothetical protein